MSDHVLTRIYEADERDLPLSAILGDAPAIDEKFWWDDGWWGDQGNTSECTAYSWTHWVEDNLLNSDTFSKLAHPLWDMNSFYHKLQLNDGIPGTNYQGSTVRAGAKVLKGMGLLEEYRWAANIDEMVNCLLTIGPMVVGTTWYNDMFNPAEGSYIVHPTGGSAGGHAYMINGVSVSKKLFRIKNSWGRSWGDRGHAYISFDDFNKLLLLGGDACVAIAAKVANVPDMSVVPDQDVAS